MEKYINSKGEMTDDKDFISIDPSIHVVEPYYSVQIFDDHNNFVGYKEFSEHPSDMQIVFAIKSLKDGDHAKVDKFYYVV